MPDKTIILPIDKSIPPDISKILIAIVKIPKTLICWKTVIKFVIAINFGLIEAIIIIIPKITNANKKR